MDAPPLETHFESVRDHALFYASRAFYVAPPPPAAPTAPPRPDYLLAGTFVIPHKQTIAWLKQKTGGRVIKVQAGDELERWHVERIELARVVLSYEDERFEISRATREAENHLTRAPLKRAARVRTVAAASSELPGGIAAPTVKSLGAGGSGVIRDAALQPAQAPVGARLYRPPEQ
jgi:hypothetical protein